MGVTANYYYSFRGTKMNETSMKEQEQGRQGED
jgi:hypothetical protein